ncbi:MAG TPA: NRDE family protein [Eoetvoesiella sp.]|uniref:NRDE family protein n=1 Tax=Eoetvoesiella sp. TaxID=1966355 RepID=UPI002B775974|nr:NRDE family protein [Eoetvoesiella sp.]HWK62833.1 NRDE family protein [Eoetvoesiella sp.]
MCIAYLAIQAHPDWPLFIAANRDEFHARAARFAAPWLRRPDIIAGIDEVAHGTWLGITRQGRYAFLTNYRDLSAFRAQAPSRGELSSRYLEGQESPRDYVHHAAASAQAYNGFNLIVGDLSSAFYLGNCPPPGQTRELGSGRYVISNHLLDTPWPKAERLRQALGIYPSEALQHSLDPVFDILKDGTQASDADLPATGLSLERERLLSSPFIISPDYGTRCSTIIAVHRSGRAILSETSYAPDGRPTQRHDWPFVIEPPAGASGT